MDLATALAARFADGPFITATVQAVNADGTVDLAVTGGTISGAGVLGSYTPRSGDSVVVARRSAEAVFVLGSLRTSNATTVPVDAALSLAWNVAPAVPALANPFTVDTYSTGTYGYGWVSDEVYQGAYTIGNAYRKGCLFYGTGFDSVRGSGITITRARLTLSRPSSAGSSAGRPFYVAGHAHDYQPTTEPVFVTGATPVGSWAWGDTATVDIPVSLGQGLVDGTIRGLGSLYLGTYHYAKWSSKTAYSLQGRLTLDWT